MLKNVVSCTYKKNPKTGIGGKYLVTLECGHTAEHYGYLGVPTVKRCLICIDAIPKTAANFSFKKIGNLRKRRIYPLLMIIGVPASKIFACYDRRRRTGSFWTRNAHQLQPLLSDFRQYYINALKKAHPDTNKRPRQDASEVTAAWQRIQQLFKQHGVRPD